MGAGVTKQTVVGVMHFELYVWVRRSSLSAGVSAGSTVVPVAIMAEAVPAARARAITKLLILRIQPPPQ
jgi:hypothetical protein